MVTFFGTQDLEQVAVFDTEEEARRFDADVNDVCEKSHFFCDKGQKRHYERRRRHFLRSVKKLVSIWGAERVASDIRDIYYDVLHRRNEKYMSDESVGHRY